MNAETNKHEEPGLSMTTVDQKLEIALMRYYIRSDDQEERNQGLIKPRIRWNPKITGVIMCSDLGPGSSDACEDREFPFELMGLRETRKTRVHYYCPLSF